MIDFLFTALGWLIATWFTMVVGIATTLVFGWWPVGCICGLVALYAGWWACVRKIPGDSL